MKNLYNSKKMRIFVSDIPEIFNNEKIHQTSKYCYVARPDGNKEVSKRNWIPLRQLSSVVSNRIKFKSETFSNRRRNERKSTYVFPFEAA